MPAPYSLPFLPMSRRSSRHGDRSILSMPNGRFSSYCVTRLRPLLSRPVSMRDIDMSFWTSFRIPIRCNGRYCAPGSMPTPMRTAPAFFGRRSQTVDLSGSAAPERLFAVAADFLMREYNALRCEQDTTRRNAQPIVDVVNALFLEVPEFAPFREQMSYAGDLRGGLNCSRCLEWTASKMLRHGRNCALSRQNRLLSWRTCDSSRRLRRWPRKSETWWGTPGWVGKFGCHFLRWRFNDHLGQKIVQLIGSLLSTTLIPETTGHAL